MTGNDIPSLGPVGGLSGELRKKRLQRAWREQAAQQALFPGCLWPRCGEQGGWGRATLLLGAVGGRGGSQWEPAARPLRSRPESGPGSWALASQQGRYLWRGLLSLCFWGAAGLASGVLVGFSPPPAFCFIVLFPSGSHILVASLCVTPPPTTANL